MCIQLYKLQAIENRSLQLQTFDPYYIRKQVLLDFYLSHPPICCRNSFFVSLADTFFFLMLCLSFIHQNNIRKT